MTILDASVNLMNNSQQIYHVLILEDGDFKKKIILKEPTYSVGRHSSNDIILLSPKTSRNHATLLRRTDVKTNNFSYWILDGDLQGNRSRNGISVNGKKCLVYELKDGDVINFGNEEKAKYQILSEQISVLDEIKENNYKPHRSSIDKKTVINKDTVINFSDNQASNNNHSLELVRLASFAELNPHPVIEIDLQGNIAYLNSSAIIALKNIQQKRTNHPLVADLIAHFNQENSKILVREVEIDGKIFLQNAHYLPENEIIRSYLTDITDKKQLASSLNEQKNIYQALSKQINEGIVFIEETSNKILEVNDYLCDLLGYSIEDILKLNLKDIQEENHLLADLEQNFREKNSLTGEYNLRHRDGSLVAAKIKVNSIKTSQGNKYLLTINTLTEEIALFLQDQITGLPDQTIFKKQLATAIANAKRNQKLVAVISLNLQRFAEINQTLGEELGNILLANFAERLKTCLRIGDTVSYWGEDKFGILMPQISGVEEAAKISQRIIELLEKSFKIRNYKFSVKCNIGIAIYPQDGEEVNVLLKNANQALYRTQEQANNYKYQFYSYSMNSQASVQLRLEALLHHALEKNEFILYYQPQINVNNGNIQGVEALLRWQHPELGLVSPASFIKIAEQTGLILPIGEWVLRTACTQNKTWQSLGIPPLRVSVNLSTLQFQQPNLPGMIAQILHETGLEPNLLELEIAAVTLMQNVEYSQKILQQLNALGVHISIDDFASGFSSLEHLKKFPFHTLKIDQSFVHDLKNDPKDLAIISALVSLGRGFNLRVVAEGVETQQQIDLLRSLECEQMQGFWFSRPLTAEDASKWLPVD
ncbi:hypothetical protein STA3757_32200 [Stanieria sp. NIES-3757]|nr:hypothetical protein STA3757_32200 [Stanieria sp. NIES-3757]